jgi:hypothetical protein
MPDLAFFGAKLYYKNAIKIDSAGIAVFASYEVPDLDLIEPETNPSYQVSTIYQIINLLKIGIFFFNFSKFAKYVIKIMTLVLNTKRFLLRKIQTGFCSEKFKLILKQKVGK